MKKSIFIFLIFFISTSVFANKNFTRNDNTILDKELMLQWQDDVLAKNTKLFLDDSIRHCEKLNYLGFKNWRLPTYEELLSLGDYEVYKPTINSIFNHTASGHYWTVLYKKSVTGEHISLKDQMDVRRIYFSDGYSYDNDRTGKAYVRCVRNII